MDPLASVKRVLDSFSPAERAELARHLAGGAAASRPHHVRSEYRRCAPGRCSTCDGGGRHGPYLYEVWREGGSVKRRYLRRGTE